jgi:hypothetical protein
MQAIEDRNVLAADAGVVRRRDSAAPTHRLWSWFKTVWVLLPAAGLLGFMPCYHLFKVWGWVDGWEAFAWIGADVIAGAVWIGATALAVVLAVVGRVNR